MGQLRGVLRSYAWDGGGPGSVLDRCDQLVQGLEMAAMATAVYARIEPPDADGTRLVRYANAGHPAPLVLTPRGRAAAARRAALADDRRGARPRPPRGLGPHRGPGALRAGQPAAALHRRVHRRRGEDADERTELLEHTVAGLPPASSAEEAAERVVAVCLPGELSDDVALLVVGLEG